MAELLKLKNVAQVAAPNDVASALLQHGTKPAASFGESSPLMSVHRRTEQDEHIWWVFNPSHEDRAVTASFATAGTPYQLDLWNGAIHRVAHWSRNEDRLTIPLMLPAHGTTAFMFQHQGTPLHVTTTTAQSASYDGDSLVLRDTEGGAKDVTLSDGTTKTLQIASVPPPMEVGNWTLVVDEISPTGNAKHTVALPQLKDWRDIPELKDAVGGGTYRASPDVPASFLGSETDVMIDVGGVAGAMQLSVNGRLVTRQTTPGGTWSVKALLKAGHNDIEVRLDTTLLNRMAQLKSANPDPSGGGSNLTSAPSGLLGPVRLMPVGLGRIQ